MVLLADAATIWRQALDRVPNNGDTIHISCNESRNTISTEGSASCVSVDAAAVSCPHASTATWHGTDQNGEASGSFRKGAELGRVEIADDVAEDLVGKIFEAR